MMMRKPLAIVFLLILAVTTEPGIQLLKFPLLFSHYTTHVTEGRSKSFPGFLKEHYSKTRHTDNDSKQDNELPFKAVSPDSFSNLYLTSFAVTLPLQHYTPQILHSLPAYHFSMQDHMAGVFHPPKAA